MLAPGNERVRIAGKLSCQRLYVISIADHTPITFVDSRRVVPEFIGQ